tara:strand:- start:432 stop:584 length:153 start_codon:yes stop_codon:yes gene_type:complete
MKELWVGDKGAVIIGLRFGNMQSPQSREAEGNVATRSSISGKCFIQEGES